MRAKGLESDVLIIEPTGFQPIVAQFSVDTKAKEFQWGAHWGLLNHSPTRERGECDVDASLILQFTQRYSYPTPSTLYEELSQPILAHASVYDACLAKVN